MIQRKAKLLGLWIATALLISAAAVAEAQSSDALGQLPEWQTPEPDRIKADTLAWLTENRADEPTLKQADALWSSLPVPPTDDHVLGCVAACIALANPDAAELVRVCDEPTRPVLLPDTAWLSDPKTPPLVANNMRLLYGRWLIHQQMYDESLQQIADLEPADVVAPASLLFYQSVAYHTLLDKESGLKTIDRLLSGPRIGDEVQSPRRYIAVAELMQQDLEILEDDSLDHIARRMGDIRRRLDLGRAGKRVRKVEDDVIESLDKLIKDIEERQKKNSGGGAGNNIRPSKPAADSMPMGGKGPGNVTKRPIGSQSGWGDLPPKQREEALQQIGRDFPAHYRDVIEQYFRRLAAEEEK